MQIIDIITMWHFSDFTDLLTSKDDYLFSWGKTYTHWSSLMNARIQQLYSVCDKPGTVKSGTLGNKTISAWECRTISSVKKTNKNRKRKKKKKTNCLTMKTESDKVKDNILVKIMGNDNGQCGISYDTWDWLEYSREKERLWNSVL